MLTVAFTYLTTFRHCTSKGCGKGVIRMYVGQYNKEEKTYVAYQCVRCKTVHLTDQEIGREQSNVGTSSVV